MKHKHEQDSNLNRKHVVSVSTQNLLVCCLSLQGLCMVIGGVKHSTQAFNPRSAGVSSTLLFVSIAGEQNHNRLIFDTTFELCQQHSDCSPSFVPFPGVFAPTLFSKAYGTLQCQHCVNGTQPTNDSSGSDAWNQSFPLQCSECRYSIVSVAMFGLQG